ncbi:MAG: helix-turn-helix domain-containing protein [Candidatus Obscuribacterales bacterium]|jgi:transcriptional regulator with XRE-family HTH domain|nr:helix-turn-helix domain-containing protein [Candidatus Obscuribacterales bacterium]
MIIIRSSIQPSLCKAIRDCRITLGLSAADFAQRLGKPVSYVEQLETASLSLDGRKLKSCASALGVSSGDLFDIAYSTSEMRAIGAQFN